MKSYFLTRRAVRHAMPGMLIALVLTACSDPVQPMPSDGNSGADAVADQISAPDTIVPVDVAPTRCRTVNDCDDGISCTEDSCGMDGMCAHTANNMRCDDGRFCNGSETCDVGRG
ncbi:MAG: hypothetical protein Q8Q09_13140, partial [Deltaproteobacteria bacterium]|nr:hypothetical protein [Deltaproteobacteria bacterium]